MKWYTNDQIRWVQFELFYGANIHHGIFSRHGGASPEPWSSLNLGGTVGDDPENTIENKKRMLNVFNLKSESVYDAWLVHSADYIRTNRSRDIDVKQLKADILVTNTPGVTLLMRYADCVPIMAYDHKNKAVGIAHAGWIGTVKNVAGNLIRAMKIEFGSNPHDLITGIGPSIGQDHYQVGDEVVEAVHNILGEQDEKVVDYRNNKPHLDLWKTNELLLRMADVDTVEIAGICTVCNKQDWFSHRGENGKTGRFGAIIQIPE